MSINTVNIVNLNKKNGRVEYFWNPSSSSSCSPTPSPPPPPPSPPSQWKILLPSIALLFMFLFCFWWSKERDPKTYLISNSHPLLQWERGQIKNRTKVQIKIRIITQGNVFTIKQVVGDQSEVTDGRPNVWTYGKSTQ